MSRRRDAVVRRGLRHIGRAIREQKGMFALAVLGSSVYGGMTVASAYVIGEITSRFADAMLAMGAEFDKQKVMNQLKSYYAKAA